MLFHVTTGGAYMPLHMFAGCLGPNDPLSDGGKPPAGLLDVSGTVYGETYQGGGCDLGMIYSLDLSKSVYNPPLYSFSGFNANNPGASDGSSPYATLVEDSNGLLFGTPAVWSTPSRIRAHGSTIFTRSRTDGAPSACAKGSLMVSPRSRFGLSRRFGMLVVALVAAGAVCGCGGNGVNGAPKSSPAVSSAPRSAGGLDFTASADHGVYARTAPIVLTYSITNPTGTEPTVTTVSGGWFLADASNASQTVHLFVQVGPGGVGSGAKGNIFRIYNNETVSYPEPTSALPPGRWQITCWLNGSIGGVFDGQQPPYAYATNPVTVTVLR
ncbi:MAG: hypothetical protein KGJ62_03000 [Armatimonadetes bacterium]|nr:hypothetical protein [Armatimonadota bacterium]MDE2207179.1 hypothetical protein [Armatimonadota bacterium]